MTEQPEVVSDTNALLNLATPLVDGRDRAPSGEDPLKAALTTYDVHVPMEVLGEVAQASRGDDLLSAAADAVMKASNHLTTHSVEDKGAEPMKYGLDAGESNAIRLANDLEAEMFVTDEFNSTNYIFVSMALDDRNTHYTTPHLLCVLAEHEVLDPRYVDAALTYYADTKCWDEPYLDLLRREHLQR